MRAYMRDQFPFLGIPAPQQRHARPRGLAGLARPAEDDLRQVALACWDRAEREYQYFACGWLRRHAKICSAGFLDTARHLIVTQVLVGHGRRAGRPPGRPAGRPPPRAGLHNGRMGPGREHLAGPDGASCTSSRYKEATDEARLFRYCLLRADHRDFFIRKAIGWALREYAKTAPDRVRAFVRSHEARLSRLSVREALKNL